MITNTKAFSFAVKTIVSKLSQNGAIKPLNSLVNDLQSLDVTNVQNVSEYNNEFLSKKLSFSITHAKHIIKAGPSESKDIHLKSMQKSAAYIHCFNPMTHQEQDIPIRIVRTHYTVSFLPSIQFLEKEYHQTKTKERIYNQEKDNTLTTQKFHCKKCSHKEIRSFSENAFSLGTVVTGCDKCNQMVVISDHLGWLQQKKHKSTSDVIFSTKQVMDLIKKNLHKAGFVHKDITQHH